jgi:hypothetical protein
MDTQFWWCKPELLPRASAAFRGDSKMKSAFIGLSLCVGALLLTACASTDDNLQRATATAIGNNTDPDAVVVTDIDRGVTSVKWKAKTPGGNYSCSADDMVRRPYCVKK